jgi:hypothetical protein
MRRYETFLIRHWRLDGGAERVEVTHVPTGTHVLLLSLAQAIEWMSSQIAPLVETSVPGDTAAVQHTTET